MKKFLGVAVIVWSMAACGGSSSSGDSGSGLGTGPDTSTATGSVGSGMSSDNTGSGAGSGGMGSMGHDSMRKSSGDTTRDSIPKATTRSGRKQ